jgi:hypothetical protein
VTVLNTYTFSSIYYYLWATSPSKPFYKLCDKIQRWFLGNAKLIFDNSKTYPLHMPLSVFQKPKDKGGFGLVNIKSLALSLKWKLFIRFKNTPSFMDYLDLSFGKASNRKKNLLINAKRKPHSINGIPGDILQAAIALKPILTSDKVEDIFTCEIKLPQVAGFPVEVASYNTKSLSARINNSIKEFETLRKGQFELISYCPSINYDTLWRNIPKIRKIRPALKCFIIKIFNAGIFLPDRCPVCKDLITTCSTLHFLTCRILSNCLVNLNQPLNVKSFLTNPADYFYKFPLHVIMLFSAYCIIMEMHFESQPNIDFIPRVKLKFENKFKRRQEAFYS